MKQLLLSLCGKIALSLLPGLFSKFRFKKDERIIYSSRRRETGHDFNWFQSHHGNVAPAAGRLSFKRNGLIIVQTSAGGQIAILLECYNDNGRFNRYIPGDTPDSPGRKFRIVCNVLVKGASRKLIFVFENSQGQVLASDYFSLIPANKWQEIRFYLKVSSDTEYQLKIYDLDVSNVPNSIGIRDLYIFEQL